MMEKIGVWSFYAGLIIAVLVALFSPGGLTPVVAITLGALGIVVGVLNVVDKEISLFLLAAIAFMVGASSLNAILSAIPGAGLIIPTLMQAIVVFIAPGAAVVALKAIWDITKGK